MIEPKKVIILKLFNQGLNIEKIAEKLECTNKLVDIWTKEFLELKQKRLYNLSSILRYSKNSKISIFTDDEIISINKEIVNLLEEKSQLLFLYEKSRIKVVFFEHDKLLLDKVDLAISKINHNG